MTKEEILKKHIAFETYHPGSIESIFAAMEEYASIPERGIVLPSDGEIEKIFPTDAFNSGEDDNAEELNMVNGHRQDGAKAIRDIIKDIIKSKLSSPPSPEGREVEFMKWAFSNCTWVEPHIIFKDKQKKLFSHSEMIWTYIVDGKEKTIPELFQIFSTSINKK